MPTRMTVENSKGKEVVVLELKDIEKALRKGDFAEKLGATLYQTVPSKRKPLKDPEAPKKNATSYMLATKEWRPMFKETNPKATAPEITKLMGAKWKALSDSEKKPFEEAAKADKVRYERAMTSYVAPPDEELAKLDVNQPKKKRGLGKAKRAAHPDEPKRPQTAFILYSNDNKASVKASMEKAAKKAAKKAGVEPAEVKGKEVTVAIREAWKQLKADVKAEGKDGGECTDQLAKYTDPAKEALEVYKVEHKAFLEAHADVAAELKAAKEESALKRAAKKAIKDAEAKAAAKTTSAKEPASDDEAEEAEEAEEVEEKTSRVRSSLADEPDDEEAESSEDSDEE